MTDGESLADRIAREVREKAQRGQQAVNEVATFLELNIDRVIPQIDNTIRSGLLKVFDSAGQHELQRGEHKGQRILSVPAMSKGGMRAIVIAKIAGRAPITQNPNDINYAVHYEGYLSTPNNRQVEFKISPDPAIITEAAALAQFIASTFEAKIRELYPST